MAIEVKNYNQFKPVRYVLEDADRSLDLNVPGKFTTQQGLELYEYEFLLSANDIKNKNYTTNYLTYTKTEAEIFDLNLPQNIENNSITTTIQFGASANGYLTVDKNNTSLSSIAFLSPLSSIYNDTNATQNFTISLSSTIDGVPLCQVWTYDGIYKKYLGLDISDYSLMFSTSSNSYFNIVKNDNIILLSILSVNPDPATQGLQFIVGCSGGNLVASNADPSTFLSDSYALINNYNIDTNYVNKSNNFVHYLSGVEVDPTKTLSSQKYNFILYNNYEENAVSGNDIVGSLNYFNLKNQISNANTVNKNLPFSLKQEQRYYSNILNEETAEKSEEYLKLNYNSYTTSYEFLPDKYTKFVLPNTIQPFERLNINSANLQQAGAYAAKSPYFSDCVYKTISNKDGVVNTTNENTETLLCAWLYDNGSDSAVWYDRYYLPTKYYQGAWVVLSGFDGAGDPIIPQGYSSITYPGDSFSEGFVVEKTQDIAYAFVSSPTITNGTNIIRPAPFLKNEIIRCEFNFALVSGDDRPYVFGYNKDNRSCTSSQIIVAPLTGVAYKQVLDIQVSDLPGDPFDGPCVGISFVSELAKTGKWGISDFRAYRYSEYKSEFNDVIESSGLTYYDVESSLVLEPSGTYYYKRVGKNYVNKILDTQKQFVQKNNFRPINVYTKNIDPETSTLIFNSSAYDTFSYNIGADVDVTGVNLSFKLNAPDLNQLKAYQLAGNNYNSGISVVKNFYFTPFIFLQQDNKIYFYNTDFELTRTVTLENITTIKDICYVSQTNDLIVVGNDRLLRIDINGNVIKQNDGSSASSLASSNYTSRIFYGIGSKATFKQSDGGAWDVDLLTLSINYIPATAPGETSILRRLDNTITSTMSGVKGVNISDTISAAISGDNVIIFKDFNLDVTYPALSTNSKIWDINSFNEKLYVQANNKLQVFNSERELLSSFNLSTSAVSGYKIDFISEDYIVKPIVFSRAIDMSLIVDKIDTAFSTSSAYQISGFEIKTYTLGISAVDTDVAGIFSNPSGLYSTNQTFKQYENKICLITKFDNEFTIDLASGRIWNEYESLWNALSTGEWLYGNVVFSSIINDNSTVTIIENLNNGGNCISLDADLISGNVTLFVNGRKVQDIKVSTGVKPLKNYLVNSFYIGAQNYARGLINDYTSNQSFLAKNGSISNFTAYNKELNEDLIRYEYLDCAGIDPVIFDVVAGVTNNSETVDTFYTYKIPGSLSNKAKVYIKNANLNDSDATKIVNTINSKVNDFLPVNVTEVTYDFSVGNSTTNPIIN